MRIDRLVPFAVVATAALFIAFWPEDEGSAQDIASVEVVNLPKVQEVQGRVSVSEPIPLSRLVRIGNVVVSPVSREDSTSLVEAGRVDTTGFTHAVLGLRGEVQGKLGREGTVGAILLPEEEPIVRTFQQTGRCQFPLEIATPVRLVDRGYFASEPERRPLAFPTYRVLLYNETDRSVEADLYVYLTN